MQKIPDNFCGYLSLGKDRFAYYAADGVVTLLPAYEEVVRQHEAFQRIQSRPDCSEYLYGSDGNTNIAMLCNGKIRTGFVGIDSSAKFSTPLIVKAAGNANGYFNMLTEQWDKYHAITFVGGNINALYNPRIAVERPDYSEVARSDGAQTVKLRPRSDFTYETGFSLNNERVTLTISVSRRGGQNVNERMDSYSLGELSSIIRVSFENVKGLDELTRYCEIVRSLVAVLTKQNNISFDEIYLSQRNAQKSFFTTATCKLFDYYENYSAKRWPQTILLNDIFDYLPNLMEMIAVRKVDALLAVLPEDNRKTNLISITNVQDLCTALEVAYDWEYASERREKDELIEELKKNIKKTIANFAQQYEGKIDISSETTISSSFQYLGLTLAKKIYILYNENKDIVDEITSKRCLPAIDENAISSFTKLRNRKTHNGIIEWGTSAQAYYPLLLLLYSCLLKHVGISHDSVKKLLQNAF